MINQESLPNFQIPELIQTLAFINKLEQKISSEKNTFANQGISIAKHLLPLQCDTQTLSAAILYPIFTKNKEIREKIATELEPIIYQLLQGVERMETIDHLPSIKKMAAVDTKQADQLRHMLLAIVDDVRIVLVKLAERLATLIDLRHASSEQQQITAKQVIELYAPLANRLGIGSLKWQLEDWSFRYLDAVNYSLISKELNQRRQDRETYIASVLEQLKMLINQCDIPKFDLSGRAKHIYSIYRKINQKQRTFQQIYDTSAFRILVPDIESCYQILGLIHEKWQPVKREFDDYIVKPKSNGYQSIHTIVKGPQDRFIEIQIRTFAMHEEAELGVAAHWKYKEDRKTKDNYENKIAVLRDVIGWQQDLSGKNEQATVFRQLFEDRVYVFTPNNKILDLPAGATPLDAAYIIHTEIGHRCRGAKINQKMVPLTHKVKTGDVIEILTSQDNKPSRDWLNPDRGYITTKLAYNKVKNWFTRQFRQEKLEKGEAIWEKIAKREGLTKNHLLEALPYYHFKTIDDLLIALGVGNITIQALIRQLKPEESTTKKDLNIDFDSKDQAIPQTPITGTENFLTQLARCCQPVPGDHISGYITKGRGVSIHRWDCYNLQLARKTRPERILEVSWSTLTANNYPVTLKILAFDEPTVIRDITAILANEHFPILSLRSELNRLQNRCHIKITVQVKDLSVIKKIQQQLNQLPHILKVERL